MAQLNFDASQVSPSQAFDLLPAGWYNAQMTDSTMTPTKDSTGAYLLVEFTVLDGDYAGCKLYDRANLQNKNPIAVEIGYKTLSAICHAVGVIQVQDSQQLHGRPLQVKVSLRAAGPGKDGKHYEARNELKGYKAIDTATGSPASAVPSWASQEAAQPAAQPWSPPAPTPSAPTPPWLDQPAAPAANVPVPPWAKAAK